MLDDIRGNIKLKSYVSYVFIGCMIIVTVLSITYPNLKELYGNNGKIGLNYLIRATIPFQHGFSDISAIIHLIINLIFFWFFGTFIEKIIGSFRFLILTGLSFLVYLFFHRVMLSYGQGFSPIIMTYAGFIFMILNQSKYLKTKSAFEDYYRLLVGLQIIIWLVVPFIMIFIPIYYDSDSNLLDAIFLGNIFHVIGGLIGLIMGYFYKGYIKEKLLQQMRKKYIKHSLLDSYSFLLAMAFPLYLIIIFFINPI